MQPPESKTPHAALLALYDAQTSALAALAERLRAQLEAWLVEAGIKAQSVGVRLKSPESLAAKLARPDRSYGALWDVTDLVGLRVIVYFEDDVDRVGRVLESRWPVAFEHSVDKRRRGDPTAFGYRSLHYVCSLREASRAPLDDAARFEVQVRTVLDHAWAEIEHDLGYKAREAMPDGPRRRLHRLAGLLELADQEFTAIRRELDAYATALPARIADEDAAVPLDGLSLVPLLACDEVVRLDDAVAGALGRPLGDAPFFPDYLVRMLVAAGVGTVRDARAGVLDHETAILAMVGPYFGFAFDRWRLSPARMPTIPRGYSLFFLAHVTVLKADALGVDKVARLARLYRELDYPDDARAAQDVAAQLVRAFDERS